jgi:hypothetical protein
VVLRPPAEENARVFFRVSILLAKTLDVVVLAATIVVSALTADDTS